MNKIEEYLEIQSLEIIEKEISNLKKLIKQKNNIIKTEENTDINIKEKNTVFYLSDYELSQIEKFKNVHNHGYSGAIGGSFDYIFTPTSIGIAGEIKCSCGESFIFRTVDEISCEYKEESGISTDG